MLSISDSVVYFKDDLEVKISILRYSVEIQATFLKINELWTTIIILNIIDNNYFTLFQCLTSFPESYMFYSHSALTF